MENKKSGVRSCGSLRSELYPFEFEKKQSHFPPNGFAVGGSTAELRSASDGRRPKSQSDLRGAAAGLFIRLT